MANGNICVRVDDLIFMGTDAFFSSFARELKKSFQTRSLDENDVMFCVDAKELNKAVRLVKDKP